MNKLHEFMGEISEAAAIAEAGEQHEALAQAKTAYEAYRVRVLAFASAEVDPASRAQQLLLVLEGELRKKAETFGSRGRRLAQELGDRARRDAGSPHKLFHGQAGTIAAEDLNASNDD
jgi:hypothetical protein